MANPLIPQGYAATCNAQGFDSPGATVFPLGSLIAIVDNYTAAYVAKVQPDTAAQAYFIVVSKTLPAGVITTVTVTLHGTSQDGTVLPAVSQSFDLQGPPAPPPTQAAQIIIGPPTISPFGGTPADPGSSTVTLV